MEYDFSGWATRNNRICSDGRMIMQNAFKDNDGQRVPLVWNHQHSDPLNVLGHADLENRDDGVYAYCLFNDTESGRAAKTIVKHGDVCALSIYANQLRQQGNQVMHGNIREVSLVLAGANPGAYIDSVISHGEESDEEAIFSFVGDELEMAHADEPADEKQEEKPAAKKESDDEETIGDVINTMSEKQKNVMYYLVGQALGGNDEEDAEEKAVAHSDDGETIGDVVDTMTEKQQNAMYYVIGQALKDKGDEKEDNSEGGNDTIMKHNIFDGDEVQENVLSHADQESILNLAKSGSVGSFRAALDSYVESNETLKHGFEAGADGIELLFPEYQDVRPGAPELITRDQGWVGTVMQKVHKSPISRIRTRQTDVRAKELRAHGWDKSKSNPKKELGNVKLLKRTTDPQTVYVKDKLERDDIIDITDFDVVAYQYSIMRMMLNEELAMAIMLGDGREDGDDDKISAEHIRPIWLDDDLYTIHVDVDLEAAKAELQGSNTSGNFGENYIYSEAIINAALYAREKFKGSGTPDFYCTPHLLNVMLLARDLNGRRMYSSKSELAAALNVGDIYTAEQFEGQKRKDRDTKEHNLLGIFVNLADYSLGATKGGQVAQFHDFDIDFNREKYLIETRVSGALTRIYSAIALEEKSGEP